MIQPMTRRMLTERIKYIMNHERGDKEIYKKSEEVYLILTVLYNEKLIDKDSMNETMERMFTVDEMRGI